MKTNKTNRIFLVPIVSFSMLLGGLVAFNRYSNKSFYEVNATSHPDNYDSYSYSGTYYSGITSSLTDGMEGTLRSTLTSLIHPTSVPVYSSSGATHLSTVLQYADEDPTNSSNMVYLYTRDSVTKNAASSWNREHVWPQSLSNNCWGQSRAGTDLLHIRPTYNSTNSKRGNLKYGEITNGETQTYNGITYGYTTGTYFMPLNATKGDVARICMYVWVAYHDEYGNSLPELTNVFQSFDTLMEWHVSDRPDVLEGNRNDYSQNTSMQGNRNPFVDHPEYAWKIFGSQCSSSVLAAAKAAYPDGEPSDGLSISKSSVQLETGNSTTISATATNSGTISWTTSNSSVCSISSGSSASGANITLTAKAAGTATITASITINATLYSKTCTVTVTNPAAPKTLSSISVSGQKTTYTVGDEFVKPTVTAHYSDSSTDDVTSSAIFTGYNLSVAGNYTVTVSYTDGTTKTTTYSITVSEGGGGSTYSYTISYTDLPTAYTTDDSERTAASGIKYHVYNCANYSGKMQFKSATTVSNSSYLETTEALELETLTINNRETNALTVYGSNTKGEFTQTIAGTNDVYNLSGYSYLRIARTSSGAAYCSSIVIDIEEPERVDELSYSNSHYVYYPGEYFDSSSFEITAHTNKEHEWDIDLADCTFSCDGHMFTYDDADGEPHLYQLTYGNVTVDFPLRVDRNEYVTPGTSDVEGFTLTGAKLEESTVTGTGNQTAANYSNIYVDYVYYSATNIYVFTNKTTSKKYISFKSSTGGEIHNTTPLVNPLISFNLIQESGSRQDGRVYVSETGGDDYVLIDSVTLSEGSYRYFKVEYDNSNTSYSDFNIEFTTGVIVEETALNVSNYIMYEDTENQCLTKLDIALGYYRNLNDSQKNVFCYSDDYVIESARDRLEAWAKHLNKEIDYENGTANAIDSFDIENSSNGYIAIVIISSSLLAIMFGSFLILKKKKTNK